ncbi:MAG: hypothetical protein SF339_18320 [Blastocatellia bacterium]|nr:hypothetical protein [Blastocatellia bacterium]
MTQIEQFDEAAQIVRDLAGIADRLTPADRRFVASWQSYLEREGAGAEIGKFRRQYLLECWAKYSGNLAPMRPDSPVAGD